MNLVSSCWTRRARILTSTSRQCTVCLRRRYHPPDESTRFYRLRQLLVRVMMGVSRRERSGLRVFGIKLSTRDCSPFGSRTEFEGSSSRVVRVKHSQVDRHVHTFEVDDAADSKNEMRCYARNAILSELYSCQTPPEYSTQIEAEIMRRAAASASAFSFLAVRKSVYERFDERRRRTVEGEQLVPIFASAMKIVIHNIRVGDS